MSFFYSYVSSKEDQKCNRVHSLNSPGCVPFSWEQEPGISKTRTQPRPSLSLYCPTDSGNVPKLPLPPCQMVPNKVVGHSLILKPPPPCAFHQTQGSKSSSQKWRTVKNNEEDPFMAALLECTKDTVDYQQHNIMKKESKNVKGGFSVRRKLNFSCRQTCDVREGNVVRLPQGLHPPPFRSSPSSKPVMRIRSGAAVENGY